MTVESRLADVEDSLRYLRNADRLQGRRVSAKAPADGDVFKWDGTNKKYEVSHPPKVFAYRAPAQTYGSGSEDALRMSVELFDTDNMWESANSSRITFNTAGTYFIDAGSSWNANPVIGLIKIKLNGTTDIKSHNIVADYRAMSLSLLTYFSAGDYIEMLLMQSSGSAKDTMTVVGRLSTLAAVWVAP